MSSMEKFFECLRWRRRIITDFFFFFFQGGFTLCTEITPCLVLVLIFMVTSLSKTKPKKCNFFCLSCEEWNWELTGINCFQRLAQQLSRKTSRELKYGRAALAMIFESKITAEKQNQKLRCVRTKLKKKRTDVELDVKLVTRVGFSLHCKLSTWFLGGKWNASISKFPLVSLYFW